MARFRSFCKRWSKATQREALLASTKKAAIPPFIDNEQIFDPALCPLLSSNAQKPASYQPRSATLEIASFLESEISQDQWAKFCEVREVDTCTGEEVTTAETPSSSRRQRLQRRPAVKSLRQAYTTSTTSNGSRHLSNVESPTSPKTKTSKSRKLLKKKASSVKAQIRQAVEQIRQKFSKKKREVEQEELFTERYALNLPEGVSTDKTELDYLQRTQKEDAEAATSMQIANHDTNLQTAITSIANLAGQETTTETNTSSTATTSTANTPAVSVFSDGITTENTSSNTTTAATSTPVGSFFSENITSTNTSINTTTTLTNTAVVDPSTAKIKSTYASIDTIVSTANTPVSSLFSEDIRTVGTASDTTVTTAAIHENACKSATNKSEWDPHSRQPLHARQAADEWLAAQHDHQGSHLPTPLKRGQRRQR